MGQRVEGKLAAHDRYHFELKLGYTLKPAVSTNKYNLEIYFFIPKSLGIHRASYCKKDFFSDLQSYIRFKTPTFSFDNLTDIDNPLSPLTRITKLLNTTCDRKKLIAELKLYACTVRVALRNSVQAMRKCIRKDEKETLKPLLTSTCLGLSKCLTNFRDIRAKFWLPSVDEDVRTAFRHVDEFLGIAIDGLLNSLHNAIVDSNLDEVLKNELNCIITPLISGEFEYRKTHNYAVYTIEGENELFLYRKGILKKIVTSILFLDTYTHEAGTIVKDIIFATAAGLAMVIFVVVSFWAGHRWSNTSMPFALALVLGYVVKDRIKDWFKLIFSNKMLRWFSDYKTRIKDPATDDKIGVCRHVFAFLYEKSVPHDVMTLRRQNAPADFWLAKM
ncbi:MAG: hypothetical protein HYU98_04025 [Deltaproteobacteria bacterium]|nr:hypothetical protein [Deltaproteobacteria bacterium]